MSRTTSLPVQLRLLKPNVRRPLGSRGPRPLPPEGLFLAEPWDTTEVPFVGPALRTPSHHTARFAIPAGW